MTSTQSNINKNREQIAALINNQNPIDANDRAYENIFKDLQGGILKNYGRKYSLYLFIQFDANNINEVKKWIREEIANDITSTSKQLKDTEYLAKDGNYLGKICKNFFLSYRGYQVLGFDLSDRNKIDNTLFKDAFKKGIKQEWEGNYRLDRPPEDYWYNPPEKWDVGKDRIDALILLAHNSLEELQNEASKTIERCENIGKVVACEAGYVLKDGKNQDVGPFGFADNLSQPLFLKNDYENYSKNQDINKWNPFASLNLVLVKDPFGESYSYGSYCVLQKLETNYQYFEKQVEELAEKLECDREKASALIIGRYKDGTPLAISDLPIKTDNNSIANSFNYADDFFGTKCPLHSHIRKVNPRFDKQYQNLADLSQQEDRKSKNRIFRAGITYFEDPKVRQIKELNIAEICGNKLNYLKESLKL